jgi:hypothetical protein
MMDRFTDDELKIPPVKYECNGICRTVYIFMCIRSFIQNGSVSFVSFEHADADHDQPKLLHRFRLNCVL